MEYKIDKFHFYNADNMAIMKSFKDKEFDLAIVDPPYGIGFGKFNRTNKASNGTRIKANKYKNSDWDSATPRDAYFIELLRISKNQIVWGGNYFKFLAKKETPNLKTIQEFNNYIKESDQNWIFWYKQNPVPNFADGELAWISFNESKQFDYRYYGNLQGNGSADDKIHSTQKPIQLYELILNKYANEDFKIIDTHLGSGSIAIAIDKANTLDKKNLAFVGIELDPDYFLAAIERFKNYKSQKTLSF